MRTLLLLLVITASFVSSALSVVYAKYHTRVLYAEVQRLQQRLEAYEEEWLQLQLEQNTLTAHNRIERMASVRLGMALPARESIIYIRP